ncbi:phospholipase A2 inhibitor gamma subunit B-like [Leptodactylus fuscus]|uniref:phospholipase A2 inhibitor gamma subunit B-like n=1 Tax=Leptodactylus fuscus TaxID=238119 RepID=UPI003F4EFE5F
MKILLALLCMFSALVCSVFSILCFSCASFNSTTCNTTKVECMGDTCMSCYQKFQVGNNTMLSMLKGCSTDVCNNTGMATQDEMNYRFTANCCKGPLCNNDTFALPKENLTRNNKECPSCFLNGTTKECVTTKMMNCTGSQDQCFNYKVELKTPDGTMSNYSIKGCSNTYACEVNVRRNIGINETKRIDISC